MQIQAVTGGYRRPTSFSQAPTRTQPDMAPQFSGKERRSFSGIKWLDRAIVYPLVGLGLTLSGAVIQTWTPAGSEMVKLKDGRENIAEAAHSTKPETIRQLETFGNFEGYFSTLKEAFLRNGEAGLAEELTKNPIFLDMDKEDALETGKLLASLPQDPSTEDMKKALYQWADKILGKHRSAEFVANFKLATDSVLDDAAQQESIRKGLLIGAGVSAGAEATLFIVGLIIVGLILGPLGGGGKGSGKGWGMISLSK